MENDKLKTIIRTLLEFGLTLLIFFLIGILATECFADASLGLINFGDSWLSFGANGDSSYNTVKGEWEFNGISDEYVRVYFPNIGDVVTDNQPRITLNKPSSYTVSYSIANAYTGEEEYVYYTGSGFTIRPIKDIESFYDNTRYIYNLEVDITHDRESDYTDLIGMWDLPQFLNNTSAFDNDSLGYGYFDVTGEILNPTTNSWYMFTRMRYYYDKSSDFVNLYVETTDAGEMRIISENESLVRYVTIDDAPNGTPNRLLAYFYDNGVNLSAQGLSVSIGGLIPNKISNGFTEFLGSVEFKINDLQTLIDNLVGESTSLWSYIVTSVDAFFSLDIGGITLGAVFGTLIAISILIAYLKLFLGG